MFVGEDVLLGERVAVWPYHPCRGAAPLLPLWNALAADAGTLSSLFWHTQGDMTLETFAGMFADHSSRRLLIVEDWQARQVVGCAYFDGIIPDFRAMLSLAMVRTHRGKPTEEAARLILTYGVQTLGLQQIWSCSPHLAAKVLMQRLGAQCIATLPEFTLIEGRPRSVDFYRLTAKEI